MKRGYTVCEELLTSYQQGVNRDKWDKRDKNVLKSVNI